MSLPSDEITMLLLLESNIFFRASAYTKVRTISMHPINQERKQFGEFHHLYKDLKEDADRFFEYTRMSVSTFNIILSAINERIKKNNTAAVPITPEERLFITLRYLSTGLSFRGLASSFRVGKTTVGSIIYETCQAIWDELVHEYMLTPTTDQLTQIAAEYDRRWRFPNCIGSIDGKHCRVKNPAFGGSTHFNYLRYFSIVLQGVADADKKFITIDVGVRGKQHDAATFRSSKLFQLLEENRFNVPLDAPLPNSNITVPHVLIGDEAYPLKPYLMRPYAAKALTPARELFNKRLSSARKCVECAFGILRGKWRFLSKAIETTTQHARILIKCACLLHNIVRTHDGDYDVDYIHTLQELNMNLSDHRGLRNRGNNNASIYAKNIRDTFTDYFETNPYYH